MTTLLRKTFCIICASIILMFMFNAADHTKAQTRFHVDRTYFMDQYK